MITYGKHYEIRSGDCLVELAKLVRGTARLVVADPPYNQQVNYGNGRAADNLPRGEFLAWSYQWLDLCADLLSPDGSLWIITSYEWDAYYRVHLDRRGMHARNLITWHETFGTYCETKFGRCSRPILYYCRDPKRRVFHPDRIPSARQTKYRDKRADPRGRVPGDVWRIPRVCGTFKERVDGVPTQLPLDLVRRIVAATSDPGDMVVDPFCGSGTTGAAAIELGRKFIGIERNGDYATAAAERLAAILGTPPEGGVYPASFGTPGTAIKAPSHR